MPKQLKIKVTDFIPEFVQLQKKGKGGLVFAHTERAVEKLSTMYQESWISAATGAALPGLPFVINSKNYHRSIKRQQISPLIWEVYSDYTSRTGKGVTDLLEAGHGNIDLKPGMLRGPKSKMGKNGRYNIISFRHNTPTSSSTSAMPLSVYKPFTQDVKRIDAAKKAGATTQSGTSYTSSSSSSGGSTSWGIKYDKASQIGKQKKTIMSKGKKLGEYTHKSGKFAGMVRLQQSSAKAKSGKYMTFRIVSSRSDPMSWIVPEQPPWPVRQSVVDFMKPFAEGILQDALKADLA